MHRPTVLDTCLAIPGCVGLYLADDTSGAICRDYTNTSNGTYNGVMGRNQPSVTPGDPVLSNTYGLTTTYILAKAGFIIGNLANSTFIAAITAANTTLQTLYCERAAAGNDIWKLEAGNVPPVRLRITHRDDAGTLTQTFSGGSFPIADNRPHIVGFTKAGTACTFYVDGNANGTATLSGTDTLTNANMEARIGEDKAGGAPWLDRIGFVAMWNRTLNVGEMRAVAQAGLGL